MVIFQIMGMRTLSFRTLDDRADELDALATSKDRDRTFIINEALDYYLELQRSHRKQILAGLADAKAGRLKPHSEVLALIEGWRQAR